MVLHIHKLYHQNLKKNTFKRLTFCVCVCFFSKIVITGLRISPIKLLSNYVNFYLFVILFVTLVSAMLSNTATVTLNIIY